MMQKGNKVSKLLNKQAEKALYISKTHALAH